MALHPRNQSATMSRANDLCFVSLAREEWMTLTCKTKDVVLLKGDIKVPCKLVMGEPKTKGISVCEMLFLAERTNLSLKLCLSHATL